MRADAEVSHAVLPRAFYARDVRRVARDLIGRHLVRDDVTLRIVECEAYGGPKDSASHCRFGHTARNAPMWGPPGHAYVVLCYGVHWMLNIVTGAAGEGQAVLIRGCELVGGEKTVLRRRRAPMGRDLLSGPGKVAQALGLDGACSGADLCTTTGLHLQEGASLPARTSPRVGIDYAAPADRAARLRFSL